MYFRTMCCHRFDHVNRVQRGPECDQTGSDDKHVSERPAGIKITIFMLYLTLLLI
jgi:hypothetical protein